VFTGFPWRGFGLVAIDAGPPCLLGAEGRLWVRLAGTVSFIIAYQHHLPGLT